MGESFRVEIKVIPVESQSEDSEGLDRRSDLGNNTETQSENSETTPWDLPVMPAPDAGDLGKKNTETREETQWSRRFSVPVLDAISPISAPAVLRGTMETIRAARHRLDHGLNFKRRQL